MTGLSRRAALVCRRLGGRFVVAAGTSATAYSHILITNQFFRSSGVRAFLGRARVILNGQVDNIWFYVFQCDRDWFAFDIKVSLNV